MKTFNKFIAILFLVALGTSTFSQDLISVADLNKAIMKKSVTLIDARSAAKFKADAHIKNAISVPYDALQQKTPVKGVLLSDAEIAKILGTAGVTTDKPIVVYDEGSGKYAGRVYWILKYLGAADVKMLDGNLKEWKAKRKPITKNPTMVKKGTFTPKVNAAIFANAADVKAGKATLIDARSAAEFNGSDAKSKGHIAGAINIEHKMVMNENGTLKSKDELTKVFSKVPSSKPVIVYCETSVRAGIIYLALTSALGYNNVKVYDGAYNEWVAKNNALTK